MTLAALAACLAFILYAGTRIYGTIGPSRAAVAADGRLVLLSHGRLHVFGTDGMRRESIDLAAIGAPVRPSDFELHRDGRVVLADPDNPELVRCSLPAGPCERVAVALTSAPAQDVLPLNAAKLLVDDDAHRYYISDNAGHRVLATGFDGRLLNATGPRVVSHPNRLALVDPGHLAVVDTDRARIVTFEITPSGIGKMVGERSTHAPGLARPGRRLPFAAQRLPDGGNAVLVAATGMRDADLLLFDAQGKATRRAELGDESDPFDVALWRGRLWVSDATRYRFDAVNLDATPGPPLEDAAFLAELETARAQPELWKTYRREAQFALVGIPLLGALLLWRLGEEPEAARIVTPPASSRSAEGATIEWIYPRPQYLRRLSLLANVGAWAIFVLYAAWIAIFMLAMYYAVFSWMGVRFVLPQLLVTLLLAGLVFSSLRGIPARLRRLRLGSSARALHFEIAVPGFVGTRLKVGSVPWSEVYADKSRLLVSGQVIFASRPLLGDVFTPEELRRLVIDRVPAANRVSPGRFGILVLRAQKLRVLFVVVVLAVAMLVKFALRSRLL